MQVIILLAGYTVQQTYRIIIWICDKENQNIIQPGKANSLVVLALLINHSLLYDFRLYEFDFLWHG